MKYNDPGEYFKFIIDKSDISIIENTQQCLSVAMDLLDSEKSYFKLLKIAFNNGVYKELIKPYNSDSESKTNFINKAIKILSNDFFIQKEKAIETVGWLAKNIYPDEWNSFISKSNKINEEIVENRDYIPDINSDNELFTHKDNTYDDNSSSNKLVKRAMLALEDGDFVKADEFAEKALDLDPENPNAYLVKLLIECKIQKPEDLVILPNPFDESNNFKKIIRFADKNLKDRMNGFVEERRKFSIYKEAVSYISDTSIDSNKKAIEVLESIVDYKDSKKKIEGCYNNIKRIIYNDACKSMNSLELEKAIKLFESIIDYSDSTSKVEQCKKSIEEINSKIEQERVNDEHDRKLFISGVIAVFIVILIFNQIYEQNKKLEQKRQEKPCIELETEFDVNIQTLPTSILANMVKCPTGTFIMGSPSDELGRYDDGETQQLVIISKPFYIGKYEVTQKEFEAVMGNNPSRFKGGNKPVDSVSWKEAKEFCDKLNNKYLNNIPEGYRFDLPTEAQWEYACRAGTTTSLNSGKNIITSEYDSCYNLDEVGWYDKNSGRETHEIGKKKPNAWGIYDMHGNVWEWCRNSYNDYPSGLLTGTTGSNSDFGRVCRGGGWGDLARDCRSANRMNNNPDNKGSLLGFRLALVPVD